MSVVGHFHLPSRGPVYSLKNPASGITLLQECYETTNEKLTFGPEDPDVAGDPRERSMLLTCCY